MSAEGAIPASWYAARRGGLLQWWTVLHPPYTLWHLSYAVLGASLAPSIDGVRLIATVAAFALAVGLAAHALDELNGRPLHTTLSREALVAVAAVALGGAVTLGALGVSLVGPGLIAFVAAGTALVLAYNLELLGGAVHRSWGFALGWGAFPTLTGYFAQTGRISPAALLAAGAAFGLSLAQRSLSAPARRLRRRTVRVTGWMTMDDGSVRPLDRATLLAPLEDALRILSWTVVVAALAAVAGHVL